MRNKSTALFCSALLLAATHGSPGLLASAPSTTKPQAAENDKVQTVDLKISGMTWPINCPKRVQSALEKVPGVISAEVTHPDKAVVKVKEGKVDAKKLIAAVEKAGYGAKLNEPKQ